MSGKLEMADACASQGGVQCACTPDGSLEVVVLDGIFAVTCDVVLQARGKVGNGNASIGGVVGNMGTTIGVGILKVEMVEVGLMVV